MKLLWLSFIILILIYFISYLLGLPWIEFFELKTMDLLYSMRGRVKLEPSVVVVGIDERTLSEFEGEGDFWPWSRKKYAKAILHLFKSGARAVLMDVSFTNPSEEDPRGDKALASVLVMFKRVVIGTYLINSKKTFELYNERVKEELRENTGYLRYVYKMKEFQELRMLSPLKIYKIRPPIKIFSSVAPSASFEIGGTDVDGTVRTLPLFIKEEWAVENKLTSGFLPHMDVLGYAIYLGQDPMRASLVVDFKRRVVEIKEGLKTYHYVPFDSMGLFHIYYYGKGEEVFKTVSFYDVYTGKFDPKDFKGKIVVIGYTATAKGLYDLRITPFSNNEPGVYIHATAIENIIRGDSLKRLPLYHKFLLLLITLGASLVLLKFEKIEINFLTFAVIPMLLGIGYYSFLNKTYLDIFYPMFSTGLMGVIGVGNKLYRAAQERRKFREFLYRYLDESVAEQIVKSGKTQLENERKEVVVLFSDIKGFTKMSEKMDPAEIVSMLNTYLDRMSRVIKEHGGMIDKFVGDAIMAIFGVPFQRDDDIERSLKCALEMRRELHRMNEEHGTNVDSGIGLHFGEVVVGNIGASFRWDYTCIGDTVNTASRIESLTRKIDAEVLVSEAIYERVKDKFEFEYAGEFSVKGKELPVRVYKLLGERV